MAATASLTPRTAVLRPGKRLHLCDDEELVRCVRAGDVAAFEAIYDRHHRGILSFCRHMLGSREEAEDAVQHTFIAAHRDITGSDKPLRLKAWLYTIARNRCLSVLRARREQVALDDFEPSVDGLSAAVQHRQDLRDLLADVHRLPEDQRAALVLAELGALAHEEIAMTLGVRKEKVKALIFQARESLGNSRRARETDCREIQEQLAVLRGGALRRTTIRRHVEVCDACRAFKDEVQRQRAGFAVILPVAPTLALKQTVLTSAAAAGGAAAAGAGTGGLLGVLGAQSFTAKALVTLTVAGGGAGAAVLGGGDASLAPAEAGARDAVLALRERADRVAAERARDFAVARAPATGRARRPAATPAAPADARTRDGKDQDRDKDKKKGKKKGKKGKADAKGRANGKGVGVTGEHPGRGRPDFEPPRPQTPPGQAKKADGSASGPAAPPARSERPATGRRGPKLKNHKKVQRVIAPKQVRAPSLPSVPRGQGVPGVPPKLDGVHDRGKHIGEATKDAGDAAGQATPSAG